MGVLDEAIREHLDLKRRQGANEAEIKSIEDEAFGSAGDVELEITEAAATSPEAADQLDKVFEQARKAEEAGDQAAEPQAGQPDAAQAPAGGIETAEPESGVDAAPEPEAEPKAEVEPPPSVEVEVEQETRIIEPADLPEEAVGDAGDALEMERRNLAGHPTENYDVDAAIAEEVELDQLSESRLSEELDRALDGPGGEAAAPETVDPETTAEPASPETEPEPEAPEAEVEIEESVTEVEIEDGEPGAESGVEDEAVEPPLDEAPSAEDADGEAAVDEAGGEFFDQDNPLEGTPDFLEDSPETDSLWFEQKDPGDFDFGD